MARRVLIVEDDESLAGKIASLLEKNLHCQCARATRIALAANLLRDNDYEMVILDRNLPDGDGLTLLRRAYGSTPVSQYLILSDWGTVQDREKGLQYGAFEYLGKPFSQIELIEKTKRLLMANGGWRDDYVKIDQDVIFIPSKRMLIVDGQPHQLPRADADLLAFLARGELVSCERLREDLPTGRALTKNAIAVRVARLRRKLGRHADRLQSHYRLGYRLQMTASAMVDTRMI